MNRIMKQEQYQHNENIIYDATEQQHSTMVIDELHLQLQRHITILNSSNNNKVPHHTKDCPIV